MNPYKTLPDTYQILDDIHGDGDEPTYEPADYFLDIGE